MKKLILFAILPLAFAVGCKDAKKAAANVTEAAADRDLQKTWQNECGKTPLDGILTTIMSGAQASVKSNRLQYKFSGANVNRVTLAYASSDCSGEAWVFTESGTFKIHDKSQKTNDGGRYIDMSFKKLTLKIGDDNGAKAANAISLCGKSDWAAGQEANVTASAKEISCYNAAVPRESSNVYRVDAGKLKLGTSTKASTKPSDRPSSLSSAVVYTAK